MSLTLKQMRYFEALARHRHFGRAAEASAISQPALSMQIKEMEAALGAALFERGARGVRLTGFGEQVAARVRDILRSTEELAELGRMAGDSLAGRLRLGVIPTVAPYLLPRLLGFLASAGGVAPQDLRVRESVTPTLLAELEDGQLDAAILALPVSAPWLSEAALLEESFVFVRPLAEAEMPVPSPEMLRQMRLLLLEEGHCFRDQALSFCSLTTAAPREMLEGSSLTTLVQMVGAGIGVTLIPEMAVPVETRSAPVSVARFAPPEPARRIGMVWRRSSPLAERLAGLAGDLRAHLAQGA